MQPYYKVIMLLICKDKLLRIEVEKERQMQNEILAKMKN